jgi:hypothetical protein
MGNLLPDLFYTLEVKSGDMPEPQFEGRTL